jgi:transposase
MNANKMLRNNDSNKVVLLVAIEMSLNTWRLAMTVSNEYKQRIKDIEAGNFMAFKDAIDDAKKHFTLPASAVAIAGYEAGREGFYPYRRLTEMGYLAYVIESSSIEVNRKKRRAKSDALDAQKLVLLMQRYHGGETSALRQVRTPSEAAEDARQVTREREELSREKTRLSNRMRGLVFAQGYRDWSSSLRGMTLWLATHAEKLPAQLKQRLQHEYERFKLVDQQIKTVTKAQQTARETATSASPKQEQLAQQLIQLRGVGEQGAWTLATELFGWRQFNNRREIGSAAGLTPTPYSSGNSNHEQGISKAGNKRVRRIMVELSWAWLRYQPDSQLSQWFTQRYGGQGKRSKRIGIVALARKLLIALWYYAEQGQLPQGALLKA